MKSYKHQLDSKVWKDTNRVIYDTITPKISDEILDRIEDRTARYVDNNIGHSVWDEMHEQHTKSS